MDKEFAKQMAKLAEVKGTDKDKENHQPDANPDDDLAAFVFEAMGSKKKDTGGRGRGTAAKAKAGPKGKAKAKGKKAKGAGEQVSVSFVDEPLFLVHNNIVN